MNPVANPANAMSPTDASSNPNRSRMSANSVNTLP